MNVAAATAMNIDAARKGGGSRHGRVMDISKRWAKANGLPFRMRLVGLRSTNEPARFGPWINPTKPKPKE
jgi:hypothetical protein